MYRSKDYKTLPLFPELFPLGGRLSAENRWMKLKELIPWDELEEIYRRYFSEDLGRPAKGSRLICGILVVKHCKRLSDRDVVEEYLENPYVQVFCGEEHFVVDGGMDASLLSKMRKRLGKEFFEKFENEVLGAMKRRKIIESREHLLDATVLPANIEYPTDTNLLNRAREWVVGVIGSVRKSFNVREKIRTYCRVARRAYLNFQKKRRKKRAEIRLMRGKLLRFLRRNVGQLEELLVEHGRRLKKKQREFIFQRLETVKRMYAQQLEMWKSQRNRVQERIVSLHLPHIRPIVRGKAGKDVEFGPKVLLSWVDGFCFLDKLEFEAYNEGGDLGKSLEDHRKRFGRYPSCTTGDGIFGTRANRALIKSIGMKAGFKALGKAGQKQKNKRWLREKQKFRGSRMEGIIGHAKNHFGLDRILYRIAGGEEIWARMGLMAMNLSTALTKIRKAEEKKKMEWASAAA